jgi:hypothetical protein
MYTDTSYVIDYLAGTSMQVEDVDRFGVLAATAPDLAHDMCLSFSALQGAYMLLDAYYMGDPPLAREPERLTDEYRELLLMSRSNWCQLVVDVVSERLAIASIASTTNPVQDPTAWEWWQRNNMDGKSVQIHTTALKFGIVYLSVWPTVGGRNDGLPKIMGESPLTTYVRFDAETGEPIAAIRLWMSCCSREMYCDLTTPDAQYHLVSQSLPRSSVQPTWVASFSRLMLTADPSTVVWKFRDPVEIAPVEVNRVGVVPYVAMYTMPDLMGGFRSELQTILPIQDRINKTTFDRMVSQEFTAFPQRAISGIDVPIDPVTGERRLPFDAAVDRVWTATSPDTKFIQFDASTGQAYLDANEADIKALAVESRTPPHYLTGGMGQFPSGESVRATEFGLSRKVQNRQQSFGDAYQQMLRLCGLTIGNAELANDPGLDVRWKDMEARSEGEIVDAILKMGTLGVPWPELWRRWGATPEQVIDWTGKLDDTLQRSQLYAQATSGPTASAANIQSKLAPSVIQPGGGVDNNESTPV